MNVRAGIQNQAPLTLKSISGLVSGEESILQVGLFQLHLLTGFIDNFLSCSDIENFY